MKPLIRYDISSKNVSHRVRPSSLSDFLVKKEQKRFHIISRYSLPPPSYFVTSAPTQHLPFLARIWWPSYLCSSGDLSSCCTGFFTPISATMTVNWALQDPRERTQAHLRSLCDVHALHKRTLCCRLALKHSDAMPGTPSLTHSSKFKVQGCVEWELVVNLPYSKIGTL